MAQTCGNYLSHFALSVDSVDDYTYNNIRTLLARYFERTLHASFFAVLVDGIRVDTASGYQPGLKTLWSSRSVEDATAVLDDEGDYRGMRTYSYHKDRLLWITASDNNLLSREDALLIDSWSNTADLPPYIGNGQSEAKTSVLVPLRYGGRVFGVLILEFADHVECTTTAKEELRIVTEALARLIWLHDTTQTRLSDTHAAFHLLEELFTASCRPLTKPSLFMASATRADDTVVGVIRTVLEEFTDQVDLVYWKNMSEHGSINTQILQAISSSQYGVCYLSEPDDEESDQRTRFRDNANVLFEAGMLHALTRDPEALPTGWVPIREHSDLSGPAPFDFAVERMIIVPRANHGVNEEAFKGEFRRMVKSMVEK
jgi:CAP12/Pycsar effector protein, TIR domain